MIVIIIVCCVWRMYAYYGHTNVWLFNVVFCIANLPAMTSFNFLHVYYSSLSIMEKNLHHRNCDILSYYIDIILLIFVLFIKK